MRKVTRPAHVQRAVLRKDSATLSAWGKKGAEAAKETLANKAAERAYYDEKHGAEERHRAAEANEHIAPIDLEDEKEASDEFR